MIVIVFGIIAGIAVILAILMLLGICAIYSPGVFIQRRNDYP